MFIFKYCIYMETHSKLCSVKSLLVNLKSSPVSENYLFYDHFGELKKEEAVLIVDNSLL